MRFPLKTIRDGVCQHVLPKALVDWYDGPKLQRLRQAAFTSKGLDRAGYHEPAKGRFRSWLFRIVRSKTIDAVRRTAVARKAVAGQQDTDFWHNLVDPDGRTPDDDWELAWEEEAGRIVWERYQQEVQDATQARNSQSRAWELRVIESCVRDGR